MTRSNTELSKPEDKEINQNVTGKEAGIGSNELAQLVQLGSQYFETQNKQTEAQNNLYSQRIEAEKKIFLLKYIQTTIFLIVVLAIVCGLIFVKNDTANGILLLSHLGAIIAGYFAGQGVERLKNKA